MKRHASMNRIYRLVWSQVLGTWIAVAENTKGCGKPASARKLVAAALALSAGALLTPLALAAPVGGQVVSGAGSIVQSGATTTVSQTSQNLSLNWRSFNIAPQETVNFVQPSASAIAVNRIFDTNGTQILGQLNANGQLYLINPNGILFGQGAQVNVGGLVATTLDINGNNLNGNTRTFSGSGKGSVINQGRINASNGGYVALLGNQIGNQGVIAAQLGSVALGAGNAATLTFSGNSLLHMQIDSSVLNSLAENGGLIQADGGQVFMNAGARDTLLTSVVNNTGVIEARTVNNQNGTIVLLGGMTAGSVNVGGTLDASAPDGGTTIASAQANGGFIETSAAHVNIANDAIVSTAAPAGSSGTWLIDPVDFTIAAIGGNMTGAALSTSLLAGNVSILSSAGTIGTAGDVNVNDTVNWAANLLTLNAQNNININAAMNATGTASLSLLYGQGAVAAGNTSKIVTASGAAVNLPAGTTNFTTLQGSNGVVKNYTVITALGAAGSVTGTDLQGMNGNLATNYALGANIAAAGTALWNVGAGFTPVGKLATPYSGTFDGLGHTISGLVVNTPLTSYVGLFGMNSAASILRNVGMVGGSVTGNTFVGGLTGRNDGTISNAYASDSVTGAAVNNGTIGGLAGRNSGTINGSYASGNVTGGGAVGGLAGKNFYGTINNSYATGIVTGSGSYVGGLVGNNYGGALNTVYATGKVSGGPWTGGLAGAASISSSIINAYATGNVTGGGHVGGLVGSLDATSTTSNAYATGNVNGTYNTGGLIGTNSGTVNNDYATGIVTGSAGSTAIGGLVGWNYTTISNSYATGSVSGGSWVGGLVGYNNGIGSTVNNSYATGSVSGTTFFGGLIGLNSGTATNSFWDTLTSGQLTSAGGLGMTTAQMQQQLNFTSATLANGNVNPLWDMTNIWVVYDGFTAPLLRSFMTPLTVTANNAVKTYDGLAYGGGNGVIYSSAPNANLLGTLSYGGNAQGAINAGGYAITPTGLYSSQQGYLINTVNGALTVNPAPLSVIANAFTKTYDGLAYSGGNGVAYTGLVNGETSAVLGGTLAYGGTSQGAINVGGYVITPGGLTSGNYTLSYVNGALTVNPATLTVTANGVNRLYGAANPALSGSVTGFVNGELQANVTTGTEVFTTGAINTSNVGVYDITGSGLVANNGNYVFTQAAGNATALTINPAPLSVAANAFTKTYDGLAYSGGNGVAYTGLVNGETSAVLGGTLAYGGTSQGAINVGGYVITPGGLTSGNYTLSYVNGALTVNPVPPIAPQTGPNVLTSLINTPVALNPSPTISILQSSGTAAGGEAFTSNSDEKEKVKIKIGATGPTLFILEDGLRLPDDRFGIE